ncbi:hypothetical protein DAI22_10g200500 [Oryza sativa Japonica Group]|nr:hypothetical protein DAI22_10g200500 [Oryza sativa Japonica Group]
MEYIVILIAALPELNSWYSPLWPLDRRTSRCIINKTMEVANEQSVQWMMQRDIECGI